MFRAKSKWYKPKKVKKLALNSQLLTVQILTNDVEVLILCLSYIVTTVTIDLFNFQENALSEMRCIFSYENTCTYN